MSYGPEGPGRWQGVLVLDSVLNHEGCLRWRPTKERSVPAVLDGRVGAEETSEG